MPQCKTCGNDHFNFQKCGKPRSTKPVDIQYRKDEPEGFSVSKRWGNWGNASVTSYRMKPLQRTGSLTLVDGEPYTPPPLDAA